MPDREKVIQAMTYCVGDIKAVDENDECRGDICPYKDYADVDGYSYCQDHMIRDALALLKEQEARVLTVEEIRSGTVEVVWLEDADKPNVIPGIWFRLSNEGGDEAVDIHVMDGFIGPRLAVYGKKWRAWTSRPTPEQMQETKWEEDNG